MRNGLWNIIILLYFASRGRGVEIRIKFRNIITTEVKISETINPAEGLALNAVISDIGSQIGADPAKVNKIENDKGKIHLTVLVIGEKVETSIIIVDLETVNHVLPLCFSPLSKEFSTLKFVRVTAFSDLYCDKLIKFSLVKFDCSNTSSEGVDGTQSVVNTETDVKTGITFSTTSIVAIVLVILFIVSFIMKVYTALAVEFENN